MAYERQIQDIDRQINEAVNNEPTARQAAEAQLKQSRGYDTQLNSVNELKKTALDTEKMLSALPADVKRRTAGRLVTNSQLNRIRSAEQAPLAAQYADTSRGLGIQQEGLAQTQSEIDRANQQRQQDLQLRLGALEGQRGSLFQQQQLAEQRAARAQAAAQARQAQDAQMRALEAAQKQAQIQGLKGANGYDENGKPLGLNKITATTTPGLDDPNLLVKAGHGLASIFGEDQNAFSNAGNYATPEELAYLKGGYKQQGDQALNSAKQYLALQGVNANGLSPQQIRQKARDLGLGY